VGVYFYVLCADERVLDPGDIVVAASGLCAQAQVGVVTSGGGTDVCSGLWWAAEVIFDEANALSMEVRSDGRERSDVEEVLRRHPRLDDATRDSVWATRFSVELSPRGPALAPQGFSELREGLLWWIVDERAGMLHTDQGDLFRGRELISEAHDL
jgi:hypothetical protein